MTTPRDAGISKGRSWALGRRAITTEGSGGTGNYTGIPNLSPFNWPAVSKEKSDVPSAGKNFKSHRSLNKRNFGLSLSFSNLDALNFWWVFHQLLREASFVNWAGESTSDLEADGTDQKLLSTASDLSTWPIGVPLLIPFATQGDRIVVIQSATANEATVLSTLPLSTEGAAAVDVPAVDYLVPAEGSSEDYINEEFEGYDSRAGLFKVLRDGRAQSATINSAMESAVTLAVELMGLDMESDGATHGTGTVDPPSSAIPLSATEHWQSVALMSTIGEYLISNSIQLQMAAGGSPRYVPNPLNPGRPRGHKSGGMSLSIDYSVTEQKDVTEAIEELANSDGTDALATGWDDGTNVLGVAVNRLDWDSTELQNLANDDESDVVRKCNGMALEPTDGRPAVALSRIIRS